MHQQVKKELSKWWFCWRVLEHSVRSLLETTDSSCRWAKNPEKNIKTWSWSYNVSNSVSQMHKVLKELKQENTSKENYKKQRKRLRGLLTRPNVKQKGKDMETLWMNRNALELKSYHEKLLNTEFAWNRNSLSQ